jgi:hypothetical protein
MREKNPHRRLPLAACLIATVLAGCAPEGSSVSSQAKHAAAEQDAVAKAEQAKPGAVAPSVQDKVVAEETADYTFRYTYPAAAAAIPGLKAKFEEDIAKSRADLAKDAAQFRADAQKDDFPFRQYDASYEWAVVTDLPGWLSLSGEIYAFTGGAHGNTGYATILWDKTAGREREVLSLFTAKAALEKAVQPALCDALDKERSKRRGEKVVRDQKDWMTACIGLDETTVILGSAGHQAFDRIGFLIGPYAAGPYAEGTYEVTLPVTAAILATVKPEFRSSFALGR